MEESEQLLYSESFPLNEKNERKRMKPVAECHKLLKDIKVDPSQIIYKPLTADHVDEVKKLHEEWFPVKYEDKIFNDTIVTNMGQFFTVGAFYPKKISENEYKDIILGLAICQWRYVDNLFFNTTNKSLVKEITDNLNYEEEAKLFLYKEKYYYCVYIMSLGVIDECRKLHIGTELMRSVLNMGANVPLCLGVYLNVISDNVSGKKFYEKKGFSCVNSIKDYYTIEDKKYTSEVYVRIFIKKEKDVIDNIKYSRMNFRQKVIRRCEKLYYFLVKLFLLVFLCRCFGKKIKTD